MPENTGEGRGGARPNAKLRGECSIANIGRVGVKLRKTRGCRDLYKKKCRSVVEGVQKRFDIRKHRNGDGMILCNRLATSKKGGRMRN